MISNYDKVLLTNSVLNDLNHHLKLYLCIVFVLMFSQAYTQKQTITSNRFIVDNVPLDMYVHEKEFSINQSEVHSINVITNKSRIKRLGYQNADSLTYILTKRYFNRSDSLKRIPSTIKMVNNNATWYYNNQPYNGHYINYYINGSKKEEGIIKNGRIFGEVRYYFKNGKLSKIRNFVNNFLIGTQTNYYVDGNRKSTINYSKGKKNGEFVEYFISGKIKSKGNYVDGNLTGNITDYYSNGSIKYTGTKKSKYESRIDELKYMDNITDGNQIIEHVFNIKKLNNKRLKKLDKCQSKFSSIIAQDSIIDDYYLSRGIIYLIKGKYDLALNDFKNVLEIEPLNYSAEYYGILTLLKKHQNTALDEIPTIDKSAICSSFSIRVNDDIHKLHEAILTEYYKYCQN